MGLKPLPTKALASKDGISFVSILLAMESQIEFALLVFGDWYSLDKRFDHFWHLG